MAEPKTKIKLSMANRLGLILVGFIVLFFLGRAAWQYFVPSRFKAHLIDKMRGGVIEVQFARSADDKPVILINEGIDSYESRRSGASRTIQTGYSYFWLVSLDGLSGKVLSMTELDKKQARNAVSFFGGMPGCVWMNASGWLQLRNPATGELIADGDKILSKVQGPVRKALEDYEIMPARATGELALMEGGAWRWRLSCADFSVKPIIDIPALRLPHRRPLENTMPDVSWTWAQLYNGTRFNLEPLSDTGERTPIMHLKITKPTGESFIVPSPGNKAVQLDLAFPSILKDNIDSTLIAAENPEGIFLETYDEKTDDAAIMRIDGYGNVIWQRHASELPDYGVSFRDVRTLQAHAEKGQLIVLMGKRLVSFDMADGRVLWTYGYSSDGRISIWFREIWHKLIK